MAANYVFSFVAEMDGVRGIQADVDDGVVFIDLRDTVRLRRLKQKMSGFIVSSQGDSQGGKFKKLNNSSQLEIAGDLLQTDTKKIRKRNILGLDDYYWPNNLLGSQFYSL